MFNCVYHRKQKAIPTGRRLEGATQSATIRCGCSYRLPPQSTDSLVRDPGRIINNPLEMGLISVGEFATAGIFAGKDCSRGVVNANRGAKQLIFSEQIIILSASMTKVSSSHRLGRAPTRKTGRMNKVFWLVERRRTRSPGALAALGETRA